MSHLPAWGRDTDASLASGHLALASSHREVREESLVGGVDLDAEMPLGEALEQDLGDGLHLAEVGGEHVEGGQADGGRGRVLVRA